MTRLPTFLWFRPGRLLSAALALAAVLGAVMVASVAASASASTPVSGASGSSGSKATLTDPICQRAVDPPDRAFSITAVMRPISGTEHMQMEFVLLSKAGSATTFTSIPGSGLGTWVSPPNPTLGQRPGDIWVLHRPVADLAGPAVYKFSVSFRWIGAGGKVLQTVTQSSPKCVQTEVRPDLYVESFVAGPVARRAGDQVYQAVIGNQGGGPAKNFEVGFADGDTQLTKTISVLAKGATQTIQFKGPVCDSAAPPTLTLDPTHVLDDINPDNNTAQATCAGLSAGATGPAGVTGTAATP